jgi:circadian clock protein KaiC
MTPTPLSTKVPSQATGCPGLDEVMGGGLPAQKSYLLTGRPGSGRSIIGLQWLREGLRIGERTTYITLASPDDRIARCARDFGWMLDGIGILDLSPRALIDSRTGVESGLLAPRDGEQANVWQAIGKAIIRCRPSRVIIDSLPLLRSLSTDESQFLRSAAALVALCHQTGCTSLLLSEPVGPDAEYSFASMAAGAIHLVGDEESAGGDTTRNVELLWFPNAHYLPGRHPLRIAPQGIEVSVGAYGRERYAGSHGARAIAARNAEP